MYLILAITQAVEFTQGCHLPCLSKSVIYLWAMHVLIVITTDKVLLIAILAEIIFLENYKDT